MQFDLKGLDLSPELSLAHYIQSIKKYPILSQEEELELALNYRKTKNSGFAYKMITSHLRLVVRIASKYKKCGLPLAEIISEGNVGLLLAVEKFEPEKGFRFSTYAMWWIKASIQKYILDSWSLVKIGTTSSQKKLFFNLKKIKEKLNICDDRELTNEVMSEISRSLDVSVQDVQDMNMRLKAHDGSLNVTLNRNSEEGREWIDFIADGKPNQEDVLSRCEILKQRRFVFKNALKCLSPREKDILIKRRLSEKAATLEDLSKFYAISKERVRQIELVSFQKLKKEVLSKQ